MSDNVTGIMFGPHANYMYGYFTSPDEIGGIVYATWVLAKVDEEDEAKADKSMKKARDMLKKTTISGPTIPPVSGN